MNTICQQGYGIDYLNCVRCLPGTFALQSFPICWPIPSGLRCFVVVLFVTFFLTIIDFLIGYFSSEFGASSYSAECVESVYPGAANCPTSIGSNVETFNFTLALIVLFRCCRA